MLDAQTFPSKFLTLKPTLLDSNMQSQFFEGEGILGEREKIEGSCLCYCAHRKMIAVKMAFVRFLEGQGSGGVRLGPGAQAPRSCPGPQIINWFSSNFA